MIAARRPGRVRRGRIRAGAGFDGAARTGQPDTEAAHREPQQHLPRAFQFRYPRGAQGLQLPEPPGVRGRTASPGSVQGHGVVPDLGSRLTQEAAAGGLVRGAEQGVGQRTGSTDPGQFLVLGADPAGQYLVDALMVGPAPGDDGQIRELPRADHGEQGLRQVVVDVRVHAQQDVPQRGRGRLLPRGPERDRPRSRDGPAAGVRSQCVEIEVRERDVPAFHPLRVAEQPGPQRVAHRPGGAQVGGMEEAAGVPGFLQRTE